MIYVDYSIYPYKNMLMCHLLSDSSLDELHNFANKLSLKRVWFQNKKNSTPHYDISKSKRKTAIKLGAIECNNRKVYEIILFWRNKT